MPMLKLLTAPVQPDGSHHIGAPGGYENWHFLAEDSSRHIRVAVSFHDGFALHPDYVKRYAAYHRKPTRNAPPTPSQFPCLQVNVFENEKCLASSSTNFPAGSFHAEEGPILKLGPNRAVFRQDQIALTVSESRQAMSVELTFKSVLTMAPPIVKLFTPELFPPGKTNAAEDGWIPARPLCEVQGQIRCGGHGIPFNGLGQHNHYYGTGPVLTVATRWLRGSVLFPRAPKYFRQPMRTPL